MGFLFYFLYFKISELCNFHQMHLLHPTGLLKLCFGSNWVQKTKTSISEISKMLFSNMDFNFTHFEIEESFGLIWVKIQNG